MSDLSEIRAILGKLQHSVGFIEGTVKAMAEQQKARDDDHDKVAARVSKIETQAANLAGKHSIISTIVAFFVSAAIAIGARFTGTH